MTRIARYMKPYLGALLLAVLLLFIQANSNLALPDYMSKIVNVGIQQGGIEHAVPVVVSPDTFNRILLFMSADDADRVRAAYELATGTSSRVRRLARPYGGVTADSVYVLTDDGLAHISDLEPAMARALIVVGGMERMAQNPQAAANVAAEPEQYHLQKQNRRVYPLPQPYE